ncbi:hypothetical protein BCV72DRAFT_13464 [Rhizopus microsporus var. microsporus]|uniref:DH domain-containing protein n=1 Tax=Rhizopus microsporus var. microsporus TaxID=86635 RepID=A0A1X0QXK7_RHIZD|nr:hypothetical protein BCV72DRAFT_13464 [Rhizopus microsporus var. microsporus]
MTTELLEIEKTYLEKLNIINSELSPQWLKEQEDNSSLIGLLNVIQDIQKVHTEIYSKLETLNEVDDGLVLYLIEEIKSVYSKYSDHFICNLSQCQDILCTPSIKQKLSVIYK